MIILHTVVFPDAVPPATPDQTNIYDHREYFHEEPGNKNLYFFLTVGLMYDKDLKISIC